MNGIKKRVVLNFVSLFVFTIGIVLLVYFEIKNKQIEYNINESLNVLNDLSHEDLERNISMEGEYDYSAIDNIDISNIEKINKEEIKSLASGRLIIPSVNINLPIFNGITNKILNNGVGIMQVNSKMGEGNFALAGHYSRRKNNLLNRLADVKIGSTIQVTDNNKIYEYIVYDKKTVEPTETEWIKDEVAYEHGKPILSLMNCNYRNGKNTGFRYFIFAELSSVKNIKD